MSINLNQDTVEVFEFKESGFLALCQEVIDFINSDSLQKYDLRADSAKFVEEPGVYKVVFERNGEPIWRIKETLRREAQEAIEGRAGFERDVLKGQKSDKPIRKIEVDPPPGPQVARGGLSA